MIGWVASQGRSDKKNNYILIFLICGRVCDIVDSSQ
jgi:hypothetical protein